MSFFKRFLITVMDIHGIRHNISRHMSLKRFLEAA